MKRTSAGELGFILVLTLAHFLPKPPSTSRLIDTTYVQSPICGYSHVTPGTVAFCQLFAKRSLGNVQRRPSAFMFFSEAWPHDKCVRWWLPGCLRAPTRRVPSGLGWVLISSVPAHHARVGNVLFSSRLLLRPVLKRHS